MSVTKTPAPKRNIQVSAIEKTVPLPAAKTSGYPLDDMEVGDSFQVTGTTIGGLNRSVSAWAKKNSTDDRKFEVRSISPGALRVWRTA